MVLPPDPSRNPASVAVQQLWSEYAGWLMALEDPLRDDEERDESWERFMHDRRRAKEKARLALIDVVRLEQRREGCAGSEQNFAAALQQGAAWALHEQESRTRRDRRKAARGRGAAAAAQRVQDYLEWQQRPLDECMTTRLRDDEADDESMEAFVKVRESERACGSTGVCASGCPRRADQREAEQRAASVCRR